MHNLVPHTVETGCSVCLQYLHPKVCDYRDSIQCLIFYKYCGLAIYIYICLVLAVWLGEEFQTSQSVSVLFMSFISTAGTLRNITFWSCSGEDTEYNFLVLSRVLSVVVGQADVSSHHNKDENKKHNSNHHSTTTAWSRTTNAI